MIDLKDYKEQPDDGLFEKIRRRMAVRRALRIGGTTLACLTVAGIAVAAVSVFALQDKTSAAPTAANLIETDEVAVTLPDTASTAAPVTETVAATETNVPALPVTMPETGVISFQEEPSTLAETLHQLMPEPIVVEPVAPRTPASVHQDEAVEDSTVISENEVAAPKATTPQPHYDNIIWAPNIIVPGGEVEENRVFGIEATSTITQFNLQIFNRRGMKVFSTTDPAFRWDAAQMPQGAYVWVASFRDSDGRPRQEKGTVVVVR